MSWERSRRVPPLIFEGRCNLDGPSQWRSPDGTTTVWYVGDTRFRIQTTDHHRAARFRRMTRVELAGECIAGGPFTQLFDTDRRKLATEAMRRLLWFGADRDKGSHDIARQQAAELAPTTLVLS